MYNNFYFDYDNYTAYVFDDKEKDGFTSFKYKSYCWIKTDEPTDFKTIFGTPVKRTNLNSEMRENPDAYETDVSPEMRILIDKYYDQDELPDNRIMVIDIEVSSVGGFADQKKANKSIISISTVMLHEKVYVTFILDKDGKFSLKSSDNKKYIVCSSEEELLRKFITYFHKIAKPTIITGWNSYQFDFPYLYRRSTELLGEEISNKFSPIEKIDENQINFQLKREIYDGYKIAGVSQLDYMILYKKYSINDRPMYNLEYISQEELGRGKIKFDGSLDDLYKKDINKFVEYNLTDIELIVELENKLHYIEIAISMCHKGCISYDNVFSQSKIIEGAILIYLKERNLVALNKPIAERTPFEGAYVKDPVPGRYKWVFSCDLTSLYPSIIRTLNISTETKFGKIIQKNPLNGDVIVEFLNGSRKEISEDKFKEFVSKKNIRVSSSNVLYRSDKKGIIPDILERWFNERVVYKKMKKKAKDDGNAEDEKQYDIKQYVTKILLNSVYGVIGLSSFRFYDRDNALSVTSTGQEILKYSESNINKFFKILGGDESDYVVYGDTDSLYVSVDKFINNYDDNSMFYITRVIANVMTNAVNERLQRFTEEILNSKQNYLIFNQEAICYSALWSKKKKYALYVLEDEGFVKIKSDGKVVSSGFTMPTINGADVNSFKTLREWLSNLGDIVVSVGIPFSDIQPKMKVKGLDTVKSDFPTAFKTVLKEILIDILEFKDIDEIRTVIKNFERSLDKFTIQDVSIPKGTKDIEKYYNSKIDNVLEDTLSDGNFSNNVDSRYVSKVLHKKGAPIHIKSAINYNAFLSRYNLLGKYRKIVSGDKLKFVHLKKNEFEFETIAFKDDIIPKELSIFIEKYIDRKSIFQSVLFNKLQDFWIILGQGKLDLNDNTLSSFF